MKTLFLIRHAKSDWSIDGLNDIDRPLNNRGYSDAAKMSVLLKAKNTCPDLIISSPAIRAISTALIFSRNLNFHPASILIDEKLYETSVKEYSKTIARIANEYNCALLFGHNPIISDFANLLNPTFKEEMSTCGIVEIHKNITSWNQFIAAKTELLSYDCPKKHA